MSSIFVTSYKVVGAGIAIAETHYAEFDRVQKDHLTIATELGADGYRSGHNGRMHSLLFAERDSLEGYRKPVGVEDHGGILHYEFVPLARNKEVVAKLESSERQPQDKDLVAKFGWTNTMVTGRGRVYRPSTQRIELPSPTYLMRLPRQSEDGWICPPTLEAITEADYMQILENHNKLVREQKDAA